MIKARINQSQFDGLSEDMKKVYEKPHGSDDYLLRIEGKPAGFVAKEELDNFRVNNTTLLKERDDFKSKYEMLSDIDPEAARNALQRIKELEEKDLLDNGKIDELIKAREVAAKSEVESVYKNKVKALQDTLDLAAKERDSLREKHQKALVKDEVLSAVKAVAAIKQNADSMVSMMCESVWSMGDDGKLVAKEGGQTLYSKTGEPLTPEEWARDFVDRQRGNLFQDHSGGGSPSDNGPLLATSNNPFSKESFNLTEQNKLYQQDPQKAQRLKVSAGR